MHSTDAKQDYFEHFKDSMKFVGMSLQASFYFTVHSVYPDAYEHQGSDVIKQLHSTLQAKLSNIQQDNI